VFPFGDTQALAHCMLDFAADRARLGAMGAGARDLVFSRYDVRHAVDGTLRAVRSVTAPR
jgi:hypothetical protein